MSEAGSAATAQEQAVTVERRVARLRPDMVALFGSEDGREGVMSFVEGREANFVGR